MADALEYLGNALSEEIYRLKMSEGFSASASGGTGQDDMSSPEEDTRDRAYDVMDELDQEIAKQDGGGSREVTSQEEYTSSESSNMASGAGEPMVIAMADFVNDDGRISKLGRYMAEKLTPYFTRSDQFQVLERALIDKVIAEQQFQVSAFVDDTSTREIGKLLGAETIISGTIAELNDAFYFNAKVVEVSSGKLLTAIDVETDRTGRLVALYATDCEIGLRKREPEHLWVSSGSRGMTFGIIGYQYAPDKPIICGLAPSVRPCWLRHVPRRSATDIHSSPRATRRHAGIPQVGPTRDDALRRRGPAGQAGQGAGPPCHRSHALPARRADHGTARRRRRAIADGAATVGRRGPHGGGDRTQPGRDQDRRLGHRPGAGGRQGGRASCGRGHAGAGRAGERVLYRGVPILIILVL